MWFWVPVGRKQRSGNCLLLYAIYYLFIFSYPESRRLYNPIIIIGVFICKALKTFYGQQFIFTISKCTIDVCVMLPTHIFKILENLKGAQWVCFVTSLRPLTVLISKSLIPKLKTLRYLWDFSRPFNHLFKIPLLEKNHKSCKSFVIVG